MAQTSSKQSRELLWLYGTIGLAGLVVWIAYRKITGQSIMPGSIILKRTSTPAENTIRDVLSGYGMDEQTIQYWICVSAFETAAWTSQVFKDSNNLFALVIPGTKKLNYGEGQTIFDDTEQSVDALYKAVIKYFGYPINFASIPQMVNFMKSKGYFTGDVTTYLNGVTKYYNQFFP